MKRGLIILILLLIIVPIVGAIAPPAPAFCKDQGYTVDWGFYENGSAYYFCVFNDEDKCDMDEFYKGNCGLEYVKEIPCRKEGEFVFSQFEECCKGLKPYGPSIGHPTCQPFSKRFVSKLICNPLYWFVEIVILILIIFFIIWAIRKKK